MKAQTLFVDADDTLWENNVYFDTVIERTASRLADFGLSTDHVRDTLLTIERLRTAVHGYGTVNFGASLEVLCEQVGVSHALGDLRPFLQAEVAALRRKRLEILEDVPDTLAQLRRRHRLVLFTKGNHDEQWDKVVRSGLRSLFHQVDVVREKNPDAYRDAARRLGVAAKARDVRGVDRVVIRDGDAIGVMLTRLGAHDTVLVWEERRVRREVRGTANRLANFDDANLRRSARAAVAAGARVERAFEILGEDLPEHLRQAGELRLAHKEASLEELGKLAEPALTKDAVAGRIRRLLATADRRAAELGIPDTEAGLSPDLLDL